MLKLRADWVIYANAIVDTQSRSVTFMLNYHVVVIIS